MNEGPMPDEQFELRLEESAVEMQSALARLEPIRPSFSAAEVVARTLREADEARRRANRQAWIWRGFAAGLAACLAMALRVHTPAPSPPRVIVKLVHDRANEDRAAHDRIVQSVAEWMTGSAEPTSSVSWGVSPASDSSLSLSASLLLRDRVLAGGLLALPSNGTASSGTRVRAGEIHNAPAAGPGPLHAFLQSFERSFVSGDQS